MWWIHTALATSWNIPSQYPTIADAMASGSVQDGDALHLLNGIHEGFDFSAGTVTDLTIYGSEPDQVTVVPPLDAESVLVFANTIIDLSGLTLDGQGTARGLLVDGGALTLHDVDVTNGFVPTGLFAGGGVLVSNSVANLTSVDIRDSEGGIGGGLAVLSSELNAAGLTLEDNLAVVGGGLFVGDGNGTNLLFTVIRGNSATDGAGIASQGALSLAGVVVESNAATNLGGGLVVSGGPTLSITDTQFLTNSAGEGGAIQGSADLDVDRTVFAGNTATTGGAAYLEAGLFTATFDNVAFCDNQAGTDSAVHTHPNGLVDFTNVLVSGSTSNTPAIGGGGDIVVRNALFTGLPGPYGLDTSGLTLTVDASVFDGTGVRTSAPSPSASYNAVDPDFGLDGTLGDPFLSVEANVQARPCEPTLQFPYAAATALINADSSQTDADGSDRDLGHLGGPGVDVQYWGADIDGDSYLVHLDCDDDNALANPGESEMCDGFDNDCDGNTDNGGMTVYHDDDGDGWGGLSGENWCPDANHVTTTGDCDNHDPGINPGVVDDTCNGVDDNCDGHIDESAAETVWYADADGDGFGDDAIQTSACAPVTGYVSDNTDCDDDNDQVNTSVPERCDNVDWNCNGDTNDGVTNVDWYFDGDGDGYGAGAVVSDCASPGAHYVQVAGDCAATNAAIHPGADELCDGIDNDCDGDVDDADSPVTDPPTWYIDDDGDGFGDPSGTASSCVVPAGYVDQTGDCDDTNPNIFEGAPEACEDGLDNDCDTLIDTDDPDFTFDAVEYGNDADDDTYGDPNSIIVACSGAQPLGYVPMNIGEDCNDAVAEINPGEVEICDNLDNDCFGGADNGLPFLDYFIDADGDFFGDPSSLPINDCAPPPGTSGNALDCDDSDFDRNPTAQELCNAIDDDCDGMVDEDVAGLDYYPDADGDGFGDENGTPIDSCLPVDGTVLDHGDCDDTNSSIYPGAPDAPDDGIDADCDGMMETIPPPTPIDTDEDGIPDDIDGNPLSAGSAPEVTPTAQDYGCGCASGNAPGWLGPLPFLFLLIRRRQD